MEKHFGNSIERGLFHIERKKELLRTEQTKKDAGIHSDDTVAVQSDLFSVEGACYELALFLLRKKQSEQ